MKKTSKFYKGIDWEVQLNKAKTFARKELDFSVLLKKRNDRISYVDLDKQEIVLHKGFKNEILLYSLLHEIGHILCRCNAGQYESNYRYVLNNFTTGSQTYRVNALHEELNAWQNGLTLAKELGIKIDNSKFETIKASCVATYLPWVYCSKH